MKIQGPGVRPIGVGEVLRRIRGKSITQLLRPEIIEASGTLQTCAGLQSGIEVAVHATSKTFQDVTSEALLLVDAENAFNSINREAALKNVEVLCPPF